MAGQEENQDFEAHEAGPGGTRVYLPCPACGRAVLLSDEARVAVDPQTYECPNCDARFYLEEP